MDEADPTPAPPAAPASPSGTDREQAPAVPSDDEAPAVPETPGVPSDLDAIAVLAANRRYYDAFERGDLDAMSDLWERSARVVCTHPGWATLRGWGPVAASYFSLFHGGAHTQFVLTQETPTVAGDAAWVSLDENLLGDQSGVTVATLNLFVRDGRGAWRMVAHHGSAVVAVTG